ncbi:hypothetical protein DAKH74_045030 [Maudiozyma humilis]|uniref:Uncharacterized protein n=1 Tax=Maudiozyma humilis TaxID=51915 RepID=A0AAV5S2R1_MAUHU|nr:hypothetical protein DAKH74_045030 [Kazachstania humilis]
MADLVDMSALSLEEMYAQRILADEKRAREANPDEPDYLHGRYYLSEHRIFEAIENIPELDEDWQNYKNWKEYVDDMMETNSDFKYITIPNHANENDPMDQGIKEVLEDTLAARLIDCIADSELADSLLRRSSMDILLALDRRYAAFEREELYELVDLAVANLNNTKTYGSVKAMMEDRLKILNRLRDKPIAILPALFLGNIQEYTTASGNPTMSATLYKRGLIDRTLNFDPGHVAAFEEMYEELCAYTEAFIADSSNFDTD